MLINQSQKKSLEARGTLSVLTIEGIGVAKKLRMELADRINLFTADNGLGKSFILDCAWYALSGYWINLPAYPREDADRDDPKISFQIKNKTKKGYKGYVSYDWKQQEWASLEERPAIPSLLIYASKEGAFAVWDSARDSFSESAKTKPLLRERKFPMAFKAIMVAR
jgi:predicted ATP-binding protein involved in virulence